MKRSMSIGVVALVVCGVIGLLVGVGGALAVSEGGSGNLTSMIVFEVIASESYLFWSDLDATIEDRGDKWDVKSNQGKWMGVSKEEVRYGYYKYVDLSGVSTGTAMVLLGLKPMEGGGLPESGHYARLDAVHGGDVLKAEVARYFDGEWYSGIRCLVTLSVLTAYQGGDLEVGDYVWVYYCTDPRPGHEGESVPIVVDKVVYP